MRPVLHEDQPDRVEHRCDGRLVVGAEYRAAVVSDDAGVDHGNDRPARLHRVEVRAEEDRQTLALFGGRKTNGDVPRVGADDGPAVVDLGRQAEVLELAENASGDGLLPAGRALDRRELHEERDYVQGGGRRHGRDATSRLPVGRPPTARRVRARLGRLRHRPAADRAWHRRRRCRDRARETKSDGRGSSVLETLLDALFEACGRETRPVAAGAGAGMFSGPEPVLREV